MDMKVQMTIDGGFAYLPGLQRPTTIDTNDLSDDVAEKLISLVNAADFFDLPERVGSVKNGAADHLVYTITVRVKNKEHTIKVNDPIERDDLAELVSYLRLLRQTEG